MTYTTTDYGWEYVLKLAGPGSITKPSTLVVGLHRDSDDNIGDDSDIADIQSEPDGTDYQRQTPSATSWTVEFVNGRFQMVLDGVPFQTGDATVSASSYFAAAEFQASGDSSPQLHLLLSGPLEGSVDLSVLQSYTLNNAGLYDGDG